MLCISSFGLLFFETSYNYTHHVHVYVNPTYIICYTDKTNFIYIYGKNGCEQDIRPVYLFTFCILYKCRYSYIEITRFSYGLDLYGCIYLGGEAVVRIFLFVSLMVLHTFLIHNCYYIHLLYLFVI